VTQDRRFHRALKRGERWALEAFYDHLRSARDDAAFWSSLTEMVPKGVPHDERLQIDRLKEHLDAPDLRRFMADVPVRLLATFMLLAFVFAACNEPAKRDAPITAAGDSTTRTEAAAATTATASAEPAVAEDAGEPAADAGPKDVQSMTPEEIKAELGAYITRAQLPASEKRRLKRVLDTTTEQKVIGSRSDLAKLFRENEPKRIAVVLEQMVLFQRAKPQPAKPTLMVRYKGVDFA
jgi:hypothetical protein